MTQTRPKNPESVAAAYESVRQQWQTCDWVTEFGQRKLNLRGLWSTQALRIARATCGSESKEWRLAAEWLRTVEDAAAAAESLAMQAINASSAGKHADAVRFIAQAVEVEAAWHQQPIWSALQCALEQECSAV